MYDFNINEMLSAYDNDPAALTDAFNKALNQEIEKRNAPEEEEDITRIAAGDVAGLWNDYIYFYCQQKGLLENIDIQFLETNPDFILILTDLLLCAYPYLNGDMFKKSKEPPIIEE